MRCLASWAFCEGRRELLGDWSCKSTLATHSHGACRQRDAISGRSEAQLGGGTLNKKGGQKTRKMFCGACFTIEKLQKRENRTEQANNSKFELLEQFATDRKTTRPIGTMR
jgi:hypothetical protein